jgi:hypothetical protein
MNKRPWPACILISGALLSVSPAEEPVIVHYSDPTLTRLETQLGVTATQKGRFEDIIVKYRDAARNGAGDAASGQASSPLSSLYLVHTPLPRRGFRAGSFHGRNDLPPQPPGGHVRLGAPALLHR